MEDQGDAGIHKEVEHGHYRIPQAKKNNIQLPQKTYEQQTDYTRKY